MARLHDSISRKRNSRRGSTAIEFALVMMCLIPLFFGTVAMGITIGRGVEAVQVTRDVGHMYGEGLDFTTNDAQQLTTQLARGFDLSAAGNALLIFSQITTAFPADCTAASVSPCANSGLAVFKQRVTMGNTGLKVSAFGTPPASYMDVLGNITVQNYLSQGSLVANGFANVLVQGDGDVAYVVEGYFQMPNLSFLSPGYSGASATGGIYARAIF
jgi:hypothetical protein